MPHVLVWYNRPSSVRSWITPFLVVLALALVGLTFWSRSWVDAPKWVDRLALGMALLLLLVPLVRLVGLMALSVGSPIVSVRRAAARAVFADSARTHGWSPDTIAQALATADPGAQAPFVDSRVRAALRRVDAGWRELPESPLPPLAPAPVGPSLGSASSDALPRRAFLKAPAVPLEGGIRAYASVDDALQDGWSFHEAVGRLGTLAIHARASHAAAPQVMWVFDGVGDSTDMVPATQRRFGRLRYIRPAA